MSEAVISSIIVAILSLVGTLAGSYISGNKTLALLDFRIKSLEETVNKHNQVIERTYELEKRTAIIDEQIDEIKKEMAHG